MTFLCWCPDMGHEPEDGEEIHACSEDYAAKEYVKKHWVDWSYPRDCEVVVKHLEGEPFLVRVFVEEYEPIFGMDKPRPWKP